MTRAGITVIQGDKCGGLTRGAASGDIRTPATIRSKLREVNAAMISFTEDVARSSASESWRSAYAAFLQAWGSFYAENAESLWSQMWGDTYTQAERFEQRLRDWQTDFRSKNYGAVSAPALRPEIENRGTGIGDLAKWGAIAAAVVAAAVVVVYVVPRS
jgi:hypothetical protein